MKRKIALFITDMGFGGAERVTGYLANGLSRRDYEVDLVLVRKTGNYLADVSPTVRVVDLAARGAIASVPKLARYLRSARPDVLVAGTAHIDVAALLARPLAGVKTRVAVTLHEPLSKFRKGLKSRLVLAAVKTLFPRADAVVSVSKSAADDAIQTAGIPPNLFHVIYNPVISPDLQSAAREPVDHPWFQPGQPGVVLGVGSLSTRKRFDVLVRAFAQVSKRRPERLVILGEGDQRPMLECLIRDLGIGDRVALPGFATNPFPYMAKAALLAMSSTFEALPTVIIESLALGTPVVSTDCPCGPSEILQGGRFGRLTPVGDVDAIAQAIEASLADGPPVVPNEVLEPYTFDFALDRYDELIAELLSRPR